MISGKKPKSLKETLVFLIICSWLVPMVIFGGFIFISYHNTYITKTETLIKNGLNNSGLLLAARLGESISLAQKPSYDMYWEKLWKDYKARNINNIYAQINDDMKARFFYDGRFDMYAYYSIEKDGPECYSSNKGFPYSAYMDKIDPVIRESVDEDINYIQLKVIDNRVFLIRNLYTVYGYEKYGMLVLGLNTPALFAEFPMEVINNVGIELNADGNLLYIKEDGQENTAEAQNMYSIMKNSCDSGKDACFQSFSNGNYRGYLFQNKEEDYHLSILYAVNKNLVFGGLYELYRIIIILTFIFLGLVIFIFYYMREQIEVPVERLVEVSRTIQEGHIGTVVEGEPMPNMEFQYLVDSFNTMSEHVKYLFESAYSEKLARKDAQIAALQAQINPHFLNNTLEMMNWQARMTGDITVCKMIEALGTVLDHSMNRENKKEIYLSEELRCADAYLYIMSMRFGQRLQTEKEIDESLLWIMVPQLILQPLIENAILHGIERVKSGKIKIHIYHDDRNVYLEVINTGKDLDEKTITRIEHLLAGDESKTLKGSGRHTSIGISNVNKRIKLVYGEQFGLSVSILEGDKFLSKITIPFDSMRKE